MTARKGSADRGIPHTRIEGEEMIWETYEMGKKLGQGAFGKVYQVKHMSTGKEWAMKFINKEKAGGSAIKLLEREVNILKVVSHPYIIQLNEVFETAKRMYLVMELCAGGELADALKEKKYYMESEVKVITKELASAIAYLHKKDIVHRDLKLENILVSKFPDATNPEDRLQIKVTDFGLSITKSGVGHDNMMEEVCGTPNYMAPEIIDNKSYSQQCDVWALGVMVYSLLCGYPPFRAKDDNSLYELIKKGDVDFTSNEVWTKVSEEAKTCIKKMLNTDPAHRLTASEVLDHQWITGDNRQSKNALELMKEWKDQLKLDEENEGNSAINGEVSPEDVVDKNSSENHSEETNNNVTETTAETERKGSGGKKPGSGGKKPSGRLSQGSIPRTTLNSLKPTTTHAKMTGSKSPLPNTRATPSGGGSSLNRPLTQNASRATPTNNKLNPSQTKNTGTNRAAAKGTQGKK